MLLARETGVKRARKKSDRNEQRRQKKKIVNDGDYLREVGKKFKKNQPKSERLRTVRAVTLLNKRTGPTSSSVVSDYVTFDGTTRFTVYRGGHQIASANYRFWVYAMLAATTTTTNVTITLV